MKVSYRMNHTILIATKCMLDLALGTFDPWIETVVPGVSYQISKDRRDGRVYSSLFRFSNSYLLNNNFSLNKIEMYSRPSRRSLLRWGPKVMLVKSTYESSIEILAVKPVSILSFTPETIVFKIIFTKLN